MYQDLRAAGVVAQMARFLFGEAGGKLSLLNYTDQTERLPSVHGHNEFPTWFAHVALQFIFEGSSLPIIHMITECFNS